MAKNLSPLDPSSYARPEHDVITDIFLNLHVDFSTKTLKGNVDLSVKNVDKTIKDLVLDVRDLNISEVSDAKSGKKLQFKVSDPVENIGSKLTIEKPSADDSYKVKISYTTSPDASGLQWLEPAHTTGKKYPYLFSQFQAIHARSVYPCQDTPAIKFKYSATITAPEHFTVLMSAQRKGVDSAAGEKHSHFEQNVPIPSYLVAITVGVLESREVGPRSHVWAEKEVIEAAAYEFAETERILKTAEDICGPYVWGTYDLLILPPSFPFGGMENPCLTFVTPTVLAGDRSLVDVVAHEIAHSWTGNLITNRNFDHFWLNEGFTVFIERKIIGRLNTPKDQDFDALNGVGSLKEAIRTMGETNQFTKLVVNVSGHNPDDAFSVVPYEKGQTFLRYLESTVGGPEKFEPFLRAYFDNFKYQSIDTGDFRKFFENYFKDVSNIKNVDWEKWLHSPGMPPVIPSYDNSLAKAADDLKLEILKSHETKADPVVVKEKLNILTPHQKIYLLQSLFETGPQTVETVKFLQTLGLDNIQNSEIKFLWLRVCMQAHQEDKIQAVFDWINGLGRMKFVRPLYRDLYDWEYARPLAIKNFEANRKNMMHVLEQGVLKDLHLV